MSLRHASLSCPLLQQRPVGLLRSDLLLLHGRLPVDEPLQKLPRGHRRLFSLLEHAVKAGLALQLHSLEVFLGGLVSCEWNGGVGEM